MSTDPESFPDSKEKILFVDDDDMIREFGAALLEHMGYAALTASDAEEGLALFLARSGEIQLVVLDVLLPGMPGREMYESVRETHPDIPFVIMSGLDYGAAVETFGDIDPDRYLAKPFSIQTLSQAVRRALERGGDS